MALIRQINLFQILNYKMTMTIEKWVKEEKMRLGRFKICCVNAQKEEGKSFPLKMPRSCWSGQYRSWDDSLDVLSIRQCRPQHASVGEKSIVRTLTHLNPFDLRPRHHTRLHACRPHISDSRFGFVVARTQSYLPERGADFEQVLVSTASR